MLYARSTLVLVPLPSRILELLPSASAAVPEHALSILIGVLVSLPSLGKTPLRVLAVRALTVVGMCASTTAGRAELAKPHHATLVATALERAVNLALQAWQEVHGQVHAGDAAAAARGRIARSRTEAEILSVINRALQVASIVAGSATVASTPAMMRLATTLAAALIPLSPTGCATKPGAWVLVSRCAVCEGGCVRGCFVFAIRVSCLVVAVVKLNGSQGSSGWMDVSSSP